IAALVVHRLPGRLARPLRDRDRRVLDDAVRAEAVFERRRKNKGLEGRAGLPLRLRRAVELALLKRPAADHRENPPGFGIKDDKAAADIGGLTQRVLRARLRGAAPAGRSRGGDRLDKDDVARLQHLRDAAYAGSEPLIAKRLAGPAPAVDRATPLPALPQPDLAR